MKVKIALCFKLFQWIPPFLDITNTHALTLSQHTQNYKNHTWVSPCEKTIINY